jgi:hypothetical protein
MAIVSLLLSPCPLHNVCQHVNIRTESMRAESEGKGISECLEESPFRLARPCSQSLAMLCERKRPRRKGVGVRREHGASKSSQFFGVFTVANLSFRIAGSSAAIYPLSDRLRCGFGGHDG